MPPRPIDRTSPMPLWAQLETELRRRIEDGEFDEGFFPTDHELVEAYEVSRHTAREAVGRLAQQGLLIRERGKGTVVSRAEFEQELGTLYSLFRSVESTGVAQTSEVIQLARLRDPLAAGQLALADDTELVFLARLRRAGGEPLAVDRAWLPAAFATPLLDTDWSHTALYDELARIGAPVPNQGWERLTPLLPDDDDRQRLGLGDRDAAFFLERLGSRDGTPVEWRTTIIRGDRFRFVSDWSERQGARLRPSTT